VSAETLIITQAVILAGGKGSRLGNLSKDCPKPMQPIGSVPFLEFVVWNLKRHGIRDIILSIGYLGGIISDFFGDGRRQGVRIRYIEDESPAGTAGALLRCKSLLDEAFFFLNGDTLFDINFDALASLKFKSGAVGAIALREVEDVSRYGEVEILGDIVVGFSEKSGSRAGVVYGGISVLSRGVLSCVPTPPASMERDVFPRLASAGGLVAKTFQGFFIDIGLPQTLDFAQSAVPAWKAKSAILLDRDGVLNTDLGYVCSTERFEWTPGAVAAVKYANDAGVLVLVITNQAGIARGKYTDSEFQLFMEWINAQLRVNGAHLDGWYYCPHHPSGSVQELAVSCQCRKPGPGMIARAIADWGLDPQRCVMIGDKDSDIEAAARCGISGLRFDSYKDDLNKLLINIALPMILSLPAISHSDMSMEKKGI